jgi:hypothetical protein
MDYKSNVYLPKGGYTIMKQKYLFITGILALLLVFSMSVIGCDPDSNIDPLNGTWVSEDGGELMLNNGRFEIFADGPAVKGTYTTSGDKLTLQVTEIYFFDGWYTKAALKSALEASLLELDEDDWFSISIATEILASLDEAYGEQTVTYALSNNGKTLNLTMDDETIIFTKQ